MAPHRDSLVSVDEASEFWRDVPLHRFFVGMEAGEIHERSGPSGRVGDAGDARARIVAIVARALTRASKRNHVMNVRIAHLLAVAALALPLSHAFAGDNTIRSRDIVVSPVGQGGIVATASESSRAVHSREIAAPTGYRGNGDIQASQVTFTKVVRSPSEFGFGQGGPDLTAGAHKSPRLASRQGGTEGGQSN